VDRHVGHSPRGPPRLPGRHWVTTSSPGSSTGSSSMHWPHPGDGDSGCRFVSMGADSCHTSDHERAWICPDLVLPGRSALEPKAAVRPMTELIFRQPTVAQATIPAELAADAPTVVTAVLCAYCRAAIPADSFVYWSPAKRLLSASCPDCHRRVTVAAPMWRRWSAVGSSGLGTSAPANDHHDPRPHARPPPGLARQPADHLGAGADEPRRRNADLPRAHFLRPGRLAVRPRRAR